jgi:ankyrin repeat protein
MNFLKVIFMTCLSISISAQPIFDAYEKGDLKKINQLLKEGADPNQTRNSNGLTLMFSAAWDNNVELMDLLYQYGGEVDLPSGKHNVTPLVPACQENAFDAVKFLVDKGADANQRIVAAGNQSPIRFACKTGNVALVTFLLENGAQLEDTPDDGITPIIQAARSDHYDLVKFLIDQGADVNAYAVEKECALNQAIKNGNARIVELLLASGAKVTYKDKDGKSSLKLAKKSKNKQIIKLIEANS